jgi:hypothetical protein
MLRYNIKRYDPILWPRRSLNWTPRDLLLWGCIKMQFMECLDMEALYCSYWIHATCMCESVWGEAQYRLDMCRITRTASNCCACVVVSFQFQSVICCGYENIPLSHTAHIFRTPLHYVVAILLFSLFHRNACNKIIILVLLKHLQS